MSDEIGETRELYVFSRSGEVDFARAADNRVQVEGEVVGAEGGIYVSGEEAVIIDLKGTIALPTQCELRLVSGYEDLSTALQTHFVRGTFEPEPEEPPAAKGIPRSVSEMMAGVEAATDATGIDYYLGEWPSQNPFAFRTRLLGQEAQRFHARLSSKQFDSAAAKRESWEQVGAWLNEAITNSPNVSTSEDCEQYWQGAKRSIECRTEDLVQLSWQMLHIKERYNVQTQLTDKRIDQVRKRIERKIADKQAYEFAWAAAGGLLGMGVGAMVGGGAGLAWQVGRVGARHLVPAFLTGLGTAVGGAVGYGTGEAVGRVMEGVSDLSSDLNRLTDLKERRDRIRKEGVRVEVVDRAMSILRRTRNLLDVDLDEGRRRQILRRAERQLERLLEEDSDEKALTWDKLTRRIHDAGVRGNLELAGELFASICDLGKEVRLKVERGSQQRRQRLLQGWTRAVLIDPLSEPDELWN